LTPHPPESADGSGKQPHYHHLIRDIVLQYATNIFVGPLINANQCGDVQILYFICFVHKWMKSGGNQGHLMKNREL
jgi:hypothetical protein